MPLIEANGTVLFHELTGAREGVQGGVQEGAPVVVFVNSIGTTLEMWDAQARALAGRYRVLRYDARGHGRSPVAAGLKAGLKAGPKAGAATIETLAADLAGLLDGLGIGRAHVVGLSLGGMTAQAFAAAYPARVHGLVLMATSAYLPGDWAARAETVQAGGMAAIVDAVMGRWFTPAFRDAPAAVALRRRFLNIDPRGYAVCCEVIGAMDLRESNGAIAAPTLIIAGADDLATPPAMGEALRGRIAGAELVVVPRAAHILNVEQAAAVNRHLLGFLASLGDEPGSGIGDVGLGDAGLGGVSFAAGLANRRAVLGAEHVARSMAAAGAFAGPWQDFITRMAWGEVWGDATIPWKTRSTVTLALMVALGREEEFKLHVRPALQNGVTLDELRSLLMQCAVYAGVPAGNAAFRWVREVLGSELDG